ncbi:serine dehydratase beta chain [Paenibacillus sp. D2_2]|nr:serine dehydratase beta chain [Paenibacillus sp. D2_2]WMT39901.1 serine dehydratase beta chain [Paenibacillus sp. D2_2]
MRFKDVFSIIGPSMVGPSSSHTAGAVRLGRTARHVLGELPEQVEIIFYGSFATTHRGHGTDLAMIAGLLDYDTDDLRIREAFARAEEAGMKVRIRTAQKAGSIPIPQQ